MKTAPAPTNNKIGLDISPRESQVVVGVVTPFKRLNEIDECMNRLGENRILLQRYVINFLIHLQCVGLLFITYIKFLCIIRIVFFPCCRLHKAKRHSDKQDVCDKKHSLYLFTFKYILESDA